MRRAESREVQLNGSIPSTSDGQSADSSALITDANISLSELGSQGGGRGMGGERPGNMQNRSSAPPEGNNSLQAMDLEGEMPAFNNMAMGLPPENNSFNPPGIDFSENGNNPEINQIDITAYLYTGLFGVLIVLLLVFSRMRKNY